MTWQGIPFKLISGETVETINLALQSIPKIVIDSSPDYTSPVITAVVSLIAGIIPAGIAVWTFKRNAKNTKLEREAQQNFLSRERAEQQLFLKEERAVQIASMEKDREIQLSIAKQNFNMQVLSVNRQAWINQLRDSMSEYIALIELAVNLSLDANGAKKLSDMQWELADRSYKNPTGSTNDFSEAIKKHEIMSRDFNEKLKKSIDIKKEMKVLKVKVSLMLNPSETHYVNIIGAMGKIDSLLSNISIGDLNIEVVTKNRHEIDTLIRYIIHNLQVCIKEEWVKVKNLQ